MPFNHIFCFNSKHIKHYINTKYQETEIPSNSTRVILYFGSVRWSCSTCASVVLFMLLQICYMHEYKYKYTDKNVVLYHDKFDMFVGFHLIKTEQMHIIVLPVWKTKYVLFGMILQLLEINTFVSFIVVVTFLHECITGCTHAQLSQSVF